MRFLLALDIQELQNITSSMVDGLYYWIRNWRLQRRHCKTYRRNGLGRFQDPMWLRIWNLEEKQSNKSIRQQFLYTIAKYTITELAADKILILEQKK
jgi:hypothetical protein